MISNELLEEVINISKKGRYISKGLLLRIAINVIENLDYKTKSKFQELNFIESDWEFALACCDRKRGIIEVDYDRLLNQERKLNAMNYLKANLSIIQYILHETEHLNEHFKSSQNDLQAKLINISSGDFVHSTFMKKSKSISRIKKIEFANKKFQEFNEEYWQVIPIEKIAEADSYRNILSSLDVYPNFKKEFKDTYLLILRDYLRALKCGYHKDYHGNELVYNIPLIDYLTALNYKIKLEDLGLRLKTNSNISSKLSIEDRMKFGLPIKEVDVKELHKQKIILKSTI